MNPQGSTIDSRMSVDQLEVSFVGRDQDAQDSVDMENFLRNLQVESAPQSYPLTLPSIGVAVLYLLALPVGPWSVFGLMVVLLVFNFVGVVIMERRKKDPTLQRFTLRIDGERFTMRGERGAARDLLLHDVIAFESGPRLSVIMGNGARVVLPCVHIPGTLRGVADPHVDVARMLNADLGRLRSARVGYRGEELRLEEASAENSEQWSDQRANLERAFNTARSRP